MDSDVSVCVIPDTPGPNVLGGKFLSQRNQSVIDVPSDDSFRMSSASDLNMPCAGQSPLVPTFAVNSRSSLSDSPVFSSRRKLLDNTCKSDQNFDSDKYQTNTFSAEVNIPPLPGSPEFARERANALKEKKVKNKLSPFTKSKYNLSPFKAGINQLSACSSQESIHTDLSTRWSLSPLETDQTCDGKKNERYSGFVKSSSLLGKGSLNSKAAGMSGIELYGPEKCKKRKVETVTRHNNNVVRPKVRKGKASYSWPSCSDSSDDESLKFSKRKKMVKTDKATDKALAFKNQDTEHVRQASEFESNTHSLPKSKVGKKTHKTWTVTCSSENNESCSNIPVIKVKAVKKNKSEKGKNVKKTSISGKKRNGPVDYLDSSDDEFLSSIADFTLPGHVKSVQSCTVTDAERKSTLPVTQTEGVHLAHSLGNIANSFSPPLAMQDISATCWNPSSSLGTRSPCHSKVHRNNLFNSPTRSPAMSSYPGRPVTHRTMTEQKLMSQGRKKKKTAESHRRLPPSFLQVSPVRHQRVGSLITSTDSPPGSQDNPIDLVSATPETRKALEEIKQLQDDEDFARRMQEQLDLEFAMSLQNSEDQNSRRDSSVPQEVASCGEEATPSPHWHAYAPASTRGPLVNNRRRGRGGVHPDDALVQLVRQTIGTLNAELGQSTNNIRFDGWLGHSPSPGRRRGRGRRLAVFSPAAGGEDYENLMNLAEMLGEVKDKGLSKSDLSRLPVVSYKKTEGQETEECNICMTDYEDGDSQKILPCFHTFHCACIDKWIKKNATCPICRVEVRVNSP